MKIGITGASGFIGSALAARHVGAGDTVRCLTREARRVRICGAEIVEGDLARPDGRLARFADGLDVLYHCAAEITDDTQMRRVNVEGTRALLEAAAGRIGRWVQLSSAGVYGRHRDGIVSEDTPTNPEGAYEVTKAEADALVLYAGRSGVVASFVLVRPAIVFGEGMRNTSLAQLVRAIERGIFFFIGDRGASANYVHVSNVVEALVLCGSAPHAHGRTYNVSDWCTVEDFVGTIADALARPRPRLRLPERPVRSAVRLLQRIRPLPLTESRIDALVTRARYPIDRIQRELDFTLDVPIAAGLQRLVATRGLA
jgi:nucleoside-diphosphate-sugar epimerase